MTINSFTSFSIEIISWLLSKSRPNNSWLLTKSRPKNQNKFKFQSQIDAGRETYINELVLDKGIRNLCPALFRWHHLTALYLDNNNVEKLPPAISELIHLQKLDVSRNMLRFLPPEIGDLIQLRDFSISNNYIRTLPYELGRLFQLQNFGILGNPLPNDILSLYHEPNGLKKLLEFMLDHLNGKTITHISEFTSSEHT